MTQKFSEPVCKGETIAVIYTNKEESIKEAEKLILSAFDIGDDEPIKTDMIYKIIN